MADKGDHWTGTAAELLPLVSLYARAEGIDTSTKPWPQSPRLLSRLIKKHRKALAAAGVSLKEKRTARERTITLTHTADDDAEEALIHEHYAALHAERRAERQAKQEEELTGGFVVHSRPWWNRKPWEG